MQNPNYDIAQKSQIIRGLYLGLLGREPDSHGLSHWLKVLLESKDLDYIIDCFVNSDEYKSNSSRIVMDEDTVISQAINVAEETVYFLDERPILIVDIGAQNLENEEHIYSDLASSKLPNRIIGFEPLEARCQERLNKSSNKNSLSLFPLFIGDGSQHTFYVNDPDTTSSLFPLNQELISQFVDLDGLKTIRTEMASTTKLDVAIDQEEHVDFLKLDIQGAELMVLQHSLKTLSKTLVVHSEVSFFEIYKGQPLFSEIEQYMRSQGFYLVDLHPQCHYPLSGNPFNRSRDWLGWADAVFFKHLDKSARWQDRMVQSLIALIVYKKLSLASWLAHDLVNTPADQYRRCLYSNL
jgi:FkbM family methyltransferase